MPRKPVATHLTASTAWYAERVQVIPPSLFLVLLLREPPSTDVQSVLGGRGQSIAAKIAEASACWAANSRKRWK